VILDIDAFAVAPEGSFGDEEAWSHIEQLRHRKNKVFFTSLTESGIGRFA